MNLPGYHWHLHWHKLLPGDPASRVLFEPRELLSFLHCLPFLSQSAHIAVPSNISIHTCTHHTPYRPNKTCHQINSVHRGQVTYTCTCVHKQVHTNQKTESRQYSYIESVSIIISLVATCSTCCGLCYFCSC